MAASSLLGIISSSPATAVLSGWILVPELNTINVGILALSASFIASGSSEASGISNAAYSKFADKAGASQVGSRMGMFIIYFAPVLASLASLYFNFPAVTPGGSLLSAMGAAALDNRSLLVALLMVIHFMKRELEVLFIHQYSGTASLPSCVGISVFYAYIAAMMVWQTSSLPQALYAQVAQVVVAGGYSVPLPLLVGGSIWLLGQLGNAYHHVRLARLRSDGSKGYKVPRGGMFDLVVAPHYLFEIVAWWGAAIAAQHLFGFVAAAGFTSYLAGRSVATRRWYMKKMEDYPADRKCLVPFLF